jgi:hypothetical protein
MRNISEAYTAMYEAQEGRRSPEERKKRAKEAGDKQTIDKIVGDYNKKRSEKKKEDPKKYYAKEEVLSYLMDEGFANNEVSAEVIASHMSEEWMQEALQPLPKDKMDRKQFRLDDSSRFERSKGNYDKSDKMLLRAQNIRNASYQAGPWKGSGADARKRAGFGIGTHKQMKDLANKSKPQ